MQIYVAIHPDRDESYASTSSTDIAYTVGVTPPALRKRIERNTDALTRVNGWLVSRVTLERIKGRGRRI